MLKGNGRRQGLTAKSGPEAETGKTGAIENIVVLKILSAPLRLKKCGIGALIKNNLGFIS
jgi:hypothetical protein